MKHNEMNPNNTDKKNPEMHLRIQEIKTLEKNRRCTSGFFCNSNERK